MTSPDRRKQFLLLVEQGLNLAYEELCERLCSYCYLLGDNRTHEEDEEPCEEDETCHAHDVAALVGKYIHDQKGLEKCVSGPGCELMFIDKVGKELAPLLEEHLYELMCPECTVGDPDCMTEYNSCKLYKSACYIRDIRTMYVGLEV